MDKQVSSRSTKEKALRLNLDDKKYGTIVEIGAGQETARWFFRVGGAAGTIAKAMSAYDMKFSDAIYGTSPRYVSRERLGTMLDHEYRLVVERLGYATHTELISVLRDKLISRDLALRKFIQAYLEVTTP